MLGTEAFPSLSTAMKVISTPHKRKEKGSDGILSRAMHLALLSVTIDAGSAAWE